MPRLMSVTLTKDAVRERRKTETRRSGWTMLRPGDHLTLCEKVMGRRKGEPLIRICNVEVVAVRRERLIEITDDAVHREGFTRDDLATYHDDGDWLRGDLASAFVEFFIEHMGGSADQEVTVIEWRYLG